MAIFQRMLLTHRQIQHYGVSIRSARNPPYMEPSFGARLHNSNVPCTPLYALAYSIPMHLLPADDPTKYDASHPPCGGFCIATTATASGQIGRATFSFSFSSKSMSYWDGGRGDGMYLSGNSSYESEIDQPHRHGVTGQEIQRRVRREEQRTARNDRHRDAIEMFWRTKFRLRAEHAAQEWDLCSNHDKELWIYALVPVDHRPARLSALLADIVCNWWNDRTILSERWHGLPRQIDEWQFRELGWRRLDIVKNMLYLARRRIERHPT